MGCSGSRFVCRSIRLSKATPGEFDCFCRVLREHGAALELVEVQDCELNLPENLAALADALLHAVNLQVLRYGLAMIAVKGSFSRSPRPCVEAFMHSWLLFSCRFATLKSQVQPQLYRTRGCIGHGTHSREAHRPTATEVRDWLLNQR